jgi:drug/metabolite transporter (DMT)-like permease
MSRSFKRPAGPLTFRRWALACFLAAAIAAGAGSAIRAGRDTGEGPTYLLDVLGLVFAVAGAVFEARAGAILLPARYPGARRRTLLMAVLGALMTLTGCVILSSTLSGSHNRLASGLTAAAAMAGFGGLLGGLGTLAWVYGTDYAGRRIEQMDDDW